MILYLYAIFLTLGLIVLAFFCGKKIAELKQDGYIKKLSAFERRFENILEDISVLIDEKVNNVEENYKKIVEILELADKKTIQLMDTNTVVDSLLERIEKERKKLDLLERNRKIEVQPSQTSKHSNGEKVYIQLEQNRASGQVGKELKKKKITSSKIEKIKKVQQMLLELSQKENHPEKQTETELEDEKSPASLLKREMDKKKGGKKRKTGARIESGNKMQQMTLEHSEKQTETELKDEKSPASLLKREMDKKKGGKKRKTGARIESGNKMQQMTLEHFQISDNNNVNRAKKVRKTFDPEIGHLISSLLQSGLSLKDIAVESHLNPEEVKDYLEEFNQNGIDNV
ncbi:hypothetical protein ACFL35_07540 [Candidatus Riflebacteria bacterium]